VVVADAVAVGVSSVAEPPQAAASMPAPMVATIERA